MTHWQHNAEWLQRRDPDLWKRIEATPDNPDCLVTPSRSDAPTLKVGRYQLHSSYDPSREAEMLAHKGLDGVGANQIAVVLGLGLGYLAEAVRKRFTSSVVVIEPDLGVVRTALQSRPLDPLKDTGLVLGASLEEAIQAIERCLNSGRGWGDVKLIPHPPSVKLHQEYFDELERRIRANTRAKTSKLGILVSTPMYGGSLPVARYCADAFRRLGHRVEVLDNEIYDEARKRFDKISSNRNHRGILTGMLNALMSESITARALDRAVDLVFCVAQSPMTPQVLAELKRHKIPVAFWFVEDWKLFAYWRDWAPQYDYFFTIQKGEFPAALQRIGVNRNAYLPLAADPEVHKPLSLRAEEQARFGSTLSHVGAGYRNRQQLFAGMTDLDLKIWGNDWPLDSSLGALVQRDGARLSTEDSVKVFNASQINLNLHSSAFHDGVNPDGDYVNPRTFEVAACGAFQLVDHRSLLPELFRLEPTNGGPDDRELATFRHEGEIKGLIEYYLSHSEERDRIAAASRKRVLAEHTYDLRMAQALDFIYGNESGLASRQHPDHIENLMEASGEDPELRELLSQFEGQGVVTLDDVIARIEAGGKRELTRPELTFLLMHEFRKWAADKELV